MRRFTGPLPFSIEPRRQKAGAHRFELCRAALETACSPRSTLLARVSEGNRTRCLDVHSVACHPATPQTPSTGFEIADFRLQIEICNLKSHYPDQDLNPEPQVRSMG